MRILVTAGPTREHLDDVRFLSSASSGRMGFAVAGEAQRRGHEVVLVTGPVALEEPEGVRVRRVVSALEMGDACHEEWPHCDAVIMTASVSDLRPAERLAGKRRKSELPESLPLARNPDILASLAKARRPGQFLIGFALQVEDGPAEARRKLREKDVDRIVLNDPGSFGAASGRFRVIAAIDEILLGEVSKATLAEVLLDIVEEEAAGA
jgi:phosphopantothenoylcysteine decarboxylase/phosphopantothenate--cysteine ligase